ncbi:alpha/beta fold hydrolase [Geodermatophilus sp. SYSU D01036]
MAEAIPGAVFEVLEEESHQPFQEVPDRWNARVDAFWQDVEARSAARRAPGRCPRTNDSGPSADHRPERGRSAGGGDG